jgi:hypothetical protein
MLEIGSLLICPWEQADADSGGWCRPVADGASAARLGCVRWLGPPERSWFDWLRGQRLEVLETEDAALLMTLVRSWGLSRAWDVYDAEERRVGAIALPILLDSEGGRRAYVDRSDRHSGRILSPAARVMADFTRQPDDATLIQFAADLEPNPFLRMLLLGSVLTEEAPPAKRALHKARQAR